MKLFSFFLQSAILSIIPTSQRSVNTSARALAPRLAPLLEPQLDSVMSKLGDIFPASLNKECSLANVGKSNQDQLGLASFNQNRVISTAVLANDSGAEGFPFRYTWLMLVWCCCFFSFFTPLALELLTVDFCFVEYCVLLWYDQIFVFTSLL